MAGLKEALEAQQVVKGPRCGVGVVLAEVDTDDAFALRAALDDPNKPTSVISRALKTVGHEVGAYSIGRHRRGDCACDRRQP